MTHKLIIIALSLLVACAPDGLESKKAELDKYRKKVSEYNQKIAALEEELASTEPLEEAKTPLTVEVKQLAYETFSRYFEVSGYMEAIRDAYISPELNGQIDQIPIRRGARVKRGDLLVKLNTDVIEKNIAEVRTSLELATRIYEKQEELWNQNIGSELQYLEARNGKESLEARLATLEKQLEMAQIRAPFAGIVDNILVKQGELASPGMQLLHLINLETMRVSARVSEAYLNSVQMGDKVELRFSSFPDKKIHASVSRLGEVIDPQTRTFTVEIILDNPDEKLKPNMLTTVRIADFSEKQGLVVPTIILKEDFNGTFLFKASGRENDIQAEKVYVERGLTVQDQTLVLEGLEPGDRVITKGYNLVSHGTPLRMNNI